MNPSLDALFARHVPSVLRDAQSATFEDDVFLNLAHRVIDEFWMDRRAEFVRHSTHKLDLDRVIDVQRVAVDEGWDTDFLLRAFLAAEIELRIEPRMTIEQRRKLGVLFRDIGNGFLADRWFAHARFCFSRAAQLFGDLRSRKLEDECWYRESLATMLQSRGWIRAKLVPLYLVAGFGYRPYRMLYVGAFTVVVAALVLQLLQPTWSPFQCFAISSMNYLAALGYGDVKDASQATQVVVIAQGFLSLVLNATLFALLVRRWFRT